MSDSFVVAIYLTAHAISLFIQWMTWGEGRPEDMKAQVMKEQANISLVAALVLTVAAAFLLNLITPDDHVVRAILLE